MNTGAARTPPNTASRGQIRYLSALVQPAPSARLRPPRTLFGTPLATTQYMDTAIEAADRNRSVPDHVRPVRRGTDSAAGPHGAWHAEPGRDGTEQPLSEPTQAAAARLAQPQAEHYRPAARPPSETALPSPGTITLQAARAVNQQFTLTALGAAPLRQPLAALPDAPTPLPATLPKSASPARSEHTAGESGNPQRNTTLAQHSESTSGAVPREAASPLRASASPRQTADRPPDTLPTAGPRPAPARHGAPARPVVSIGTIEINVLPLPVGPHSSGAPTSDPSRARTVSNGQLSPAARRTAQLAGRLTRGDGSGFGFGQR